MKKLSRLVEGTTAYRDMIGQLLPRGPIWRYLAQRGMLGLVGALGEEAVRFHNRMVDLMLEAFPSTATELLAEWEKTYGLPLCADAPTSEDARRAALAGRVAAVGGASVEYFTDLIWAVLESGGTFSRTEQPDGVTIEEWPYGVTLRAWEGSAWDAVADVGAMFHWRVKLPSGTPRDLAHIVECLLRRYKPAHTILELVSGVTAYYSSPGGLGNWAKASTPLAARLFFSSTSKPVVSYVCWARKADTVETLALVDVVHESDDTLARLRWTDDPLLTIEVQNSAGSGASADLTPPDEGAEWHHFALVCDGTDATTYVDGVEVDSQSLGATPYGKCDAFMIFALHITGLAAEGDLRNIGIFDRALSAAEIDALRAAPGAETHDCRVATGAWAGEVPSVYWCQAAVARLMWSYYTEDQGLLTVENPIVSGDATVLFWLSVGTADEGEHIVQGPFEVVISAGGGGFVVGLDSGFDAAVYAHDALHQFALVANGTDHKLYVDGMLRITHVDASSFVGDLEFFGAFALPSARYTIVNPAIFDRALSAAEIACLYVASSPHDYRNAAGDDWTGETPVGYWRDEPIGGVVASIGTAALTLTLDTGCAAAAVEGSGLRVLSSGSAGVCDLNLYANVTSEED